MKKGFTLVELLVVMAIISVLVAIGVTSFRTAQLRGRDAERKSELKQIAHSLELFYADYGKYPDSTSASGGLISACPYDSSTSTGTSCPWGTGEFTDGKTSYFKTMPSDPSVGQTYLYRIVPSSSNQKYQLFAKLENLEDPNVITTTYSCGGSAVCNFAVTSANTSATE